MFPINQTNSNGGLSEMKKRLRMLPILAIFTMVIFGQNYVGSVACMGCHGVADLSQSGYNIYDTFMESGHPYKLNEVNGAAPLYPWSYVPSPPMNVFMDGSSETTDFTWDDITYVIGGYGWKARFLDSNGYIITGNNVQYNLETEGWSGYHSSEALGTKKYNCGRCHTTGWTLSDDGDPTNNQDQLEGLVGTFSEPGIHCEACHGPASDHMMTMSADDIVVDSSSELCGNCHYRDSQNRIEYKGGFIRHHEQYDEMLHSPHYAALTCNTCHDPHASTVYDDQALGMGVRMECETCHPTQAANFNHDAGATCIDCHMPEASKSAVASTIYNGDIKTHIFSINTNPVTMEDMVYYDDASGKYFVQTDENGQAAVTLDYACYGCHNDPNGVGGGGSIKTIQELAAFAPLVHAPQEADNFIGSEACLSCHADKSSWRNTLHANGFTQPTGEFSMVDKKGIICDVNQNGIDDFMDGLDLSTVPAFAQYGMYAPVLGYDAATDTYTITIGELTMPVFLTYGGSGLYKQRYIVKIPLADGTFSEGHYVSPIQYNEVTDEYVTYHPDAWYDANNMPLYSTYTTAVDVASTGKSFEKGCVGCHFTYTEVSQTADGEWIADAPDAGPADVGVGVYDVDGDETLDLINTGCERCHGPGGDHYGNPAGIVNPEDLSTQQANDLCGFCHSRGKSFPNETLSYPFNDDLMEDWEVGDAWGDYYIDHGGYYPDGQVEGEVQSSKKHHQQYFDFYESSKPTFTYHEVRCYECHDPHGGGEHQIVEEIEDDGLIIATEPDNNTLCLACHATHGDFADLTKEMIADYDNNVDAIAAVVTQHTNHPYDPENGLSRCTKCHNPKTIKSAIQYDIHSHTFEVIPPYKTVDYQMPNACSVSCHRSIENSDTPIFLTGADGSLSDWSEASDVALAEALMGYYGPGGLWWNTGLGCTLGDLDESGAVDVLDIVRAVGIILGQIEPTEIDNCAGDVNADGALDILDIVIIVDWIMNPSREDTAEVNTAGISIKNGVARLISDGDVAGVQLDVAGNFQIVTASVSPGWEIYSSDDRIILFSMNGSRLKSETLFTYEGDMTFVSGLVADWTYKGTSVTPIDIPGEFTLLPAYPNPFNPVTTIQYGLPYDSKIQITVFDMLGREVIRLADGEEKAGIHKITWNAENYSSGVYMIQMTAENYSSLHKVMLLK